MSEKNKIEKEKCDRILIVAQHPMLFAHAHEARSLKVEDVFLELNKINVKPYVSRVKPNSLADLIIVPKQM